MVKRVERWEIGERKMGIACGPQVAWLTAWLSAGVTGGVRTWVSHLEDRMVGN